MKKKLTATIGMIALIFSLSTSAFADDNINTEGVPATATIEVSMVGDGKLISVSFAGNMFDFDELVANGIITSSEKVKIEEYMELKLDEAKKEFDNLETMTDAERESYFASKENVKIHRSIFEDLLADGLLTQEQIDKIEAYQDEQRLLEVEKITKEETASYVSENLITQDEKNAIDELAINNYKETAQEVSELATSIENMTEEERESFLKSGDTFKATTITRFASSTNELALENNIITEEQYNKINDYNESQMILEISTDIKERTTAYLDAGIINAEEKTNIDNYLIEKNSNFDVSVEYKEISISIPAMKTIKVETNEDSTNEMISIRGESNDSVVIFASSFFMNLDELVENNIITTEQAEKIQELDYTTTEVIFSEVAIAKSSTI